MMNDGRRCGEVRDVHTCNKHSVVTGLEDDLVALY